MIVRNSRNSYEIDNVEISKGLKNVQGLMFKKNGRILMDFWFSDYHGIWMPFMKFSLDLIFIDRNNEVVDIKENILPISFNPKTWKVYRPKKRCKYVLEIESCKISKKIKSGDKLDFIFQ